MKLPLPIDRAVPKPKSSKRDAKLCDNGALGVKPLGNKGYADNLTAVFPQPSFPFLWLHIGLAEI